MAELKGLAIMPQASPSFDHPKPAAQPPFLKSFTFIGRPAGLKRLARTLL